MLIRQRHRSLCKPVSMRETKRRMESVPWKKVEGTFRILVGESLKISRIQHSKREKTVVVRLLDQTTLEEAI